MYYKFRDIIIVNMNSNVQIRWCDTVVCFYIVNTNSIAQSNYYDLLQVKWWHALNVFVAPLSLKCYSYCYKSQHTFICRSRNMCQQANSSIISQLTRHTSGRNWGCLCFLLHIRWVTATGWWFRLAASESVSLLKV